MDWSEIEKFIQESGGRALIVIDGQPAIVMMSYQDYQKENQPSSLLPMMTTEEEANEPERRELMIDDLPL